MDAVVVFVAEIVLSIAVSAVIIARLQHLMRRIGAEACEAGGGSTEFWVAYTQLMVFIAPLLLISWLSRAGSISVPVEQMKSSLFVVLVGHFFGLALVGRAVWKTLVRNSTPAATALFATPETLAPAVSP
jgi:hypothetical protein